MDKYQLLRDYLKKVVAEKQQNNILDQFTMVRGHGYNSEDPLAWSGEQLALREQFPQLFLPGNTVKFYDFVFQFPTKNIYLNEVQREVVIVSNGAILLEVIKLQVKVIVIAV